MDIPPRSGTNDESRLVSVTELANATEALCAIAAALTLEARRKGAATDVDRALSEVLGALGLGEVVEQLDGSERRALACVIQARVAEAHDFACDPAQAPVREPRQEQLESHWLSAGALAEALRGAVVPQLRDLEQRLASPAARFLEVGAGMEGLATAMCRLWPRLSAVCVDVWPAALAAARQRVAAAGLLDRIELRTQGVALLGDRDAFDFVWLAARGIPSLARGAPLSRVLQATRAGGWVAVGMLGGATPLTTAVARLRTARAGGAVVWPSEAETALRAAGWQDVRSLPRDTVPSVWMTVARRLHGQLDGASTPRPPRV